MAFDESLAARIRDALARKKNIEEKKMFGCICFFLNGNALAGVWKDRLIARLGPDEGEAALREPHVRAFDITGRPMRNWVAVEPEGVEDDDQLKGVDRAGDEVRADAAEEVGHDQVQLIRDRNLFACGPNGFSGRRTGSTADRRSSWLVASRTGEHAGEFSGVPRTSARIRVRCGENEGWSLDLHSRRHR